MGGGWGGGGVAGDCAADGGQLQGGQPACERRGVAAGGGASFPRAACPNVRWPSQDLTPFFAFDPFLSSLGVRPARWMHLLTRALFQGLEKLA